MLANKNHLTPEFTEVLVGLQNQSTALSQILHDKIIKKYTSVHIHTNFFAEKCPHVPSLSRK